MTVEDAILLIEELCDCLEEEFGSLETLEPELKDKRPWSLVARAREAIE